jgi:two-component system LytT family response regulator
VENDFMIKAVILVNSIDLLTRLKKMIEEGFPNLEIAGYSHDIEAGVGLVNEIDPDLVLLETHFSSGSGFDLIRHFDKPGFKIIFLSASTDYAYNAIRCNATDYILLPLNKEELVLSVRKAIDAIRFEDEKEQKALGDSFKNFASGQRLVLKASDQVYVVNIRDIIRIEADRNYSTFFMEDGRQIVISKSLKEYEEMLLEYGFHRIHKSHIFNINKISHIDKADGGFIAMIDGSRVPIASRKKDMLIELFDEIKLGSENVKH